MTDCIHTYWLYNHKFNESTIIQVVSQAVIAAEECKLDLPQYYGSINNVQDILNTYNINLQNQVIETTQTLADMFGFIDNENNDDDGNNYTFF